VAEQVCAFEFGGQQLVGILTLPERAPRRHGVVIVVGGEQYRAGSHRQFTLLARAFAEAGYPVLRFDFRGMGDSEGAARPFDARTGELEAAIGALLDAVPTLEGVVLWGLCDGASAALLHGAGDRRVAGLALLNPWVGDARTQARATLNTYYRRRLFDPAFWAKLRAGHLQLGRAVRGLAAQVGRAWRRGGSAGAGHGPDLLAAWRRFQGPVLLLLSGADLTAQAFVALGRADRHWQRQLQRGEVSRFDLAHADHTCSRPEWHQALQDKSCAWLEDRFPD
jgi:exosortase A-associated hydrolase 1